ncbi:agmatinase [Thermodesulfobacteriota bacterium]
MDKDSFVPFGGPEIQCRQVDKAKIAVLPLCYEKAPSYGSGSGEGPYHILHASLQLERIDEETFLDWGSFDIHTLPPPMLSNDPQKAMLQMEQAAAEILNKGKFLLSLGGDHAVSLGPVKAAGRIYPDLGVLQIDAHLDLRNEWNGSRYNHACVMRRITDDYGIPIIPVGIRSFSAEEADYVKKRELKPFYAHQIEPLETGWIRAVLDALPSRVYMSIDLDGLDPSVIPGTGTPEPGGLSYRQLVKLIEAVGCHRKVVAADITELTKIEGSQVSEFTAAKIATKIFVYCI